MVILGVITSFHLSSEILGNFTNTTEEFKFFQI